DINEIESPAGEYDSHIEVSNKVASDLLGIGYVARAYVGNAKEIYISGAEQERFMRGLYLYIPVQASEVAKQFLAYAVEEKAQALIAELGFGPEHTTGTPRDDCPRETVVGVAGCKQLAGEVLLEKLYFDSSQIRYTDNATMRRVVAGVKQC